MLSGVNIFVGDLYILKYFSRKKCIMKITNSVNLTKEYDKSFVSYSCNVCRSVLNKEQNKKI